MKINQKKFEEVLSMLTDPSKREPVEHVDIYTEEDPVIRLNDGDFLFYSKISDEKWDGPGVLKVYASWCPYCKDNVECFLSLSTKLKNNKIYVLDGTINPLIRFALGINSYPTFLKILPDGNIADVINDLDEVKEYLASLGEDVTSACSK